MHSTLQRPLSQPLHQYVTGFYAVLDRDDEALAHQLVSAQGAGARVLQLRIKPDIPLTANELCRLGRMARAVCDQHGAALIVNDRLDVALACEADGCHLGQDDLPLADARAALAACGRRLWLGISTHNLEQVRAAVAGGADYLGFGPVFATRTKANPDPVVGVAGLAEAVRAAGSVPVVAIGGIGLEDAAAVYAAGAAAICAISAVNGAPDIASAGRRLCR